MKNNILKYVISIAEERNFSKAANKLYISQPSLSQAISRLEADLGVNLFDRSTSPLTLTYAGEIFVQYARKIVSLQQQLEYEISQIAEMKKGRLRVGVSPFWNSCIIPIIVPPYRQMFPEVQLDFISGTKSELLAMIGKEQLDLVVTVLPLPEDQLVWEPIITEKIVLAVPPERPINERLAKYQVPVSTFRALFLGDSEDLPPGVPLEQFRQESFILPKPGQNLYKRSIELCNNAKFSPNIVASNIDLRSILAMVLSGLGSSFIPDTLIMFGNIAEHPVYYYVDDPAALRRMVAGYPNNKPIPRSAVELIKLMKRVTELVPEM